MANPKRMVLYPACMLRSLTTLVSIAENEGHARCARMRACWANSALQTSGGRLAAVADQPSRNAESRRIRFRPPALLRAAAMRGPAWKNTHVFCALSRCLSSSVRPKACTRVAVNAKSMSAGGRHSKLPLNLQRCQPSTSEIPWCIDFCFAHMPSLRVQRRERQLIKHDAEKRQERHSTLICKPP